MSSGVALSGGDSLHAKRITTRPAHFVFAFAVGADRNALDFFPQPGGPDDTHSPLALGAAKDFLQLRSSLTWFSSEVPSRPILDRFFGGFAFCRRTIAKI